MKKLIVNYGNGETEEFSMWWIILFILSFFVCLYLAINFIHSTKDAKRIKTEGICTIVTVTEVLNTGAKGGPTIQVKYLVGDTIVHSSVGSRLIYKHNTQYWAKYLPDKPKFVRLLFDENEQLMPVGNPLEIPSTCNCKTSLVEPNL